MARLRATLYFAPLPPHHFFTFTVPRHNPPFLVRANGAVGLKVVQVSSAASLYGNGGVLSIIVNNRDGRVFWFCVPALTRSWHLRNAGTQELKFCTGAQERGTRKNRNANFAFLWRNIEQY